MLEPEDLFKFLRDGDKEIIENARSFLKFHNPTDAEIPTLVYKASDAIDKLAELKGQLNNLLTNYYVKMRQYETSLEPDISYKNKDEKLNQLLSDTKYRDMYQFIEELNHLIEYINDLWWNIRNLINYYSK